MNEILELVSKRIREYRIKRGLSQEELAHRAELSTAHLGRIERGEKNATIIVIGRVIDALGIPFEEFFSFQNAPSQNTSEPMIDRVVAYLKAMTPDEQKDVFNTVKMLVRWKDKS